MLMSMLISFQLKVSSHIQTKSTEPLSVCRRSPKMPFGLHAATDRKLFVAARLTDLDCISSDEAVARLKLEF